MEYLKFGVLGIWSTWSLEYLKFGVLGVWSTWSLEFGVKEIKYEVSSLDKCKITLGTPNSQLQTLGTLGTLGT